MGDFNVQPTSDKLDRFYRGPTFGGGVSGRFKEVGQEILPRRTVHATVPLRAGWRCRPRAGWAVWLWMCGGASAGARSAVCASTDVAQSPLGTLVTE